MARVDPIIRRAYEVIDAAKELIEPASRRQLPTDAMWTAASRLERAINHAGIYAIPTVDDKLVICRYTHQLQVEIDALRQQLGCEPG